MTLLHLSIEARAPQAAAEGIATLLGGPALPFPPCDGAWMAFSAVDDGTAIEVYPAGTRVMAGPEAIRFDRPGADVGATATHAAVASPLGADAILTAADRLGWPARRCGRGPFDCIEVWIEDRVLIEVLDPDMLEDYRRNMTARAWRGMFGL